MQVQYFIRIDQVKFYNCLEYDIYFYNFLLEIYKNRSIFCDFFFKMRHTFIYNFMRKTKEYIEEYFLKSF